MGEMFPEGTPVSQPGVPSSGPPAGGVHPAWNPLLEVVPQDLHEKVIPVLKDWSSGVDKSFQRYAPYKKFIDQRVDPEELDYGLRMYQLAASNPQQLFYGLAEQLGIDVASLYNSGGTSDEGNEGEEPDVQALLEAQRQELLERDDMLAQYLLQRQEAEEVRTAEQALDGALDAAHKKFSKDRGFDFDELWVLSRMDADDEDVSLEDAIEDFYQFMENHEKSRPRTRPPVLLGAGGALPSKKPDIARASTDDLNKYVASVLESYAQQK